MDYDGQPCEDSSFGNTNDQAELQTVVTVEHQEQTWLCGSCSCNTTTTLSWPCCRATARGE